MGSKKKWEREREGAAAKGLRESERRLLCVAAAYLGMRERENKKMRWERKWGLACVTIQIYQ